MMKTLLAALLVSAALSTPALAQDRSTSLGVGVTAGTLGVGPEVNLRAANFGLRGSATFFTMGRSVESDGLEYDGDLKLRSAGGSIDFYPVGGGLRISPGVRISRNRLELTANAAASTSVEIGDVIYTGAQIGVLTGEVRPSKLAPTLTIGFGSGRGRGLYFGIDGGVMFQGSTRVKRLDATGPLATNAAFQAQLARERAEIEDDIGRFKLYPILQLGVGLRF